MKTKENVINNDRRKFFRNAMGFGVAAAGIAAPGLLVAGSNNAGSECTITEFKIPSCYPDLQSALDDLAGKRFPGGATINLEIEKGHVPMSGATIKNVDLSHVRIIGGDPEVIWGGSYFIRADNSLLPVIATRVNMNGNGGTEENAAIAMRFCSLYIEIAEGAGRYIPGNGIINSGGDGVWAFNCRIYGERCSIYGHANHNLRVSTSQVHVRLSKLDGAGGIGIRASYGSSVRANVSNISNCGSHNINVIRSRVIVESCDLSGAGRSAVVANRGSHVHLRPTGSRQTDLSNAGEKGIFARNGSIVDAHGNVKIHQCGEEGIRVQQLGMVVMSGAGDIRYCDRGVVATQASTVNVRGATIKDSVREDIYCLSGSSIEATDTLTTNGSPSLGDANVPNFNVSTNLGTIYNGNAEVRGGGLVESGSNVNGFYKIYADGTLKCWRQETIDFSSFASGNRYAIAGGGTWQVPFPFPFDTSEPVMGSWTVTSLPPSAIRSVLGRVYLTTRPAQQRWELNGAETGSGAQAVVFYAEGKAASLGSAGSGGGTGFPDCPSEDSDGAWYECP
jgi:hypothetical protein